MLSTRDTRFGSNNGEAAALAAVLGTDSSAASFETDDCVEYCVWVDAGTVCNDASAMLRLLWAGNTGCSAAKLPILAAGWAFFMEYEIRLGELAGARGGRTRCGKKCRGDDGCGIHVASDWVEEADWQLVLLESNEWPARRCCWQTD